MANPLISVFTISRNNPGNVAVAIHTILRQTIPDFEYFVIEASNDGITRGIVKNFTDPRIKLIEEDISSLPEKKYIEGYLKNKYFPKAKGKYIAVLSDNNIMMTNCFIKHFETFSSFDKARATHHGAEVLYTDLKKPSYQNIYKNVYRPEDEACKDMGSGNILFERDLLHYFKGPYFNDDLDKKESERQFLAEIAKLTDIYPTGVALHIERRTIEDDKK